MLTKLQLQTIAPNVATHYYIKFGELVWVWDHSNDGKTHKIMKNGSDEWNTVYHGDFSDYTPLYDFEIPEYSELWDTLMRVAGLMGHGGDNGNSRYFHVGIRFIKDSPQEQRAYAQTIIKDLARYNENEYEPLYKTKQKAFNSLMNCESIRYVAQGAFDFTTCNFGYNQTSPIQIQQQRMKFIEELIKFNE